ncbi:MAG: ABC transporter substrate-binding protein, partial [Variibacter sp.]|nr:ABC transporter substrate-binding protein [Variibacter sp.]
AFAKAKALSMHELSLNNVLRVSLPWAPSHYEATRAVMGKNIWPYGLAENRDEIAAMTRYAQQDGLAPRMVDPAELFHPSTHDKRDVI